MSTNYYFCDPSRSAYYQYLYDNWDEFRASVKDAFQEFCKKAPPYMESEEITETVGEQIMHRLSAYALLPETLEDEHRIGVFIGNNKFRWATQNGFHSIEDVTKYQTKHPNEAIYSEYRQKSSLDDLIKKIKSCQCS